MSRFHRRPWLFLLLTLAHCTPSSQPPVSVMALVLGNNGAYAPTKVALTTVDDIVALDGAAAEIRGGAEVRVDPEDPLLQAGEGNLDADDWLEILLKNKGQAPRANYIEKDGALWPVDFHSWNLVTTYYNFEQSLAYFTSAYDSPDFTELYRPRVLYFPTFVLAEQSEEPGKDNALFFPPVQSFVLLPFEELQKVPLAMNLGVIGHEYAHLVFNKKVLEGASLPAAIIQWLSNNPTPALNLLKALDEGLADFHGYGVTCNGPFGCDSRYFTQSLSKEISEERDLSKPGICLNNLRSALDSFNVGPFTNQSLHYRVGTVLAASLYQAGLKTGQLPNLQKAVVRAYDSPSKGGLRQLINQNLSTPANFTLEAVVHTFLTHVNEPALKAQLCSEFWDRLAIACPSLPCSLLPACPAGTVRGTSCP